MQTANIASDTSAPGVTRALNALRAFAALLACADPQAWASVGKPEAAGLAAIAHTLTGELESEIDRAAGA